jgi:hypothetical protein
MIRRRSIQCPLVGIQHFRKNIQYFAGEVFNVPKEKYPTFHGAGFKIFSGEAHNILREVFNTS